jgi:hypothetical protein
MDKMMQYARTPSIIDRIVSLEENLDTFNTSNY